MHLGVSIPITQNQQTLKGKSMLKKVIPLSLVLCGSLFAADNLFEVTPEIGGSWHISNDRYKDSAELSYGIKFAGRFAPTWLLEVGYERFDKADYKGRGITNQRTDSNRYFAHLVKEFAVDGKISPYILGGFGYEDLTNNIQSMDSAWFGQYGLGIRWELAKFLHLKTEVRHLASFDGRSDIIAMLGLAIPFGTYTEYQEPKEPAAPVLSHIHTFQVQFPFDSSVVNPQYEGEIRDFAEYMKQNPNTTAVIKGYTDSIGNPAYNQKLSERRANAVKDKIIENGIDYSRLDAQGYGEANPIYSNSTAEGRQGNRRVEAEVYNYNGTQQ